jgi:hypothetical protein
VALSAISFLFLGATEREIAEIDGGQCGGPSVPIRSSPLGRSRNLAGMVAGGSDAWIPLHI